MKSKVIVTSRRNDNKNNAEIAADGKQLEAVEAFKYLGSILDEDRTSRK